jgi:cytochrome c oxidase subunit 4
VLVLLYFMHLRYSSKLTWLFAGAGFVWLLIMIGLMMTDYISRGWVGQ